MKMKQKGLIPLDWSQYLGKMLSPTCDDEETGFTTGNKNAK